MIPVNRHDSTGILTKIAQAIHVKMCQFTGIPITRLSVSLCCRTLLSAPNGYRGRVYEVLQVVKIHITNECAEITCTL